ncbi:MAG: hypothetical protein GQ565_12935, partial [Candidatus Aegiribacteria sp.]|nr:hypothetical protein [Candidatus Aegiribacteria sp.]
MRLLTTILITLASISLALPWPIAPVNQTHKIDGSYGGSNVPWDSVSAANPYGNFHAGIDIFLTELTPAGDEEEVYAVEPGYITDIIENTDQGSEDENWIIICDTPSSSDEGWAYLHVKNTLDRYVGYHVENTSEYIANVHQDTISTSHLHFQRSGPTWTDPTGLCNPFDYLAPAALRTYWNFMPQPGLTEHPWCFFLEDKTTAGWENWLTYDSIYADTLAADSLYGSVDIIQGFWLRTNGDIGSQAGLPEDWAVPHRIKWECVQEGASSTEQSIFTRYLASFDGTVGAMADYEKYRQFYFRYTWLEDYFPGSYGDMICLTNCGDATGWNGINNIEENSWNTVLSADGSGDSYHPLNMQTPDGSYHIDVTAYAWDTTVTQGVSIDCELRNTKEIAQEVHLTDAVTDQDIWHAEWVATYGSYGFTPEKTIFANVTMQPGSTLDVEIIFSGPMSTGVDPYVRFTKPDGTFLTADPSTPEWTSTNLPDGYFDTWHGTVDIPVEGYSGWMTMKIKAKDISDIGLLDPSIADPDPPSGPGDDEYTDDHHGFGIAFSVQPGWPVTLHDYAKGSPVLADLDADGDLDVVIQSTDGWVHLLADSGNTLNSHWPMHSGGWGSINVYACPSIV